MEKNVIATQEAPQAIGPYSQGVVWNGLVFISGQLPMDPATGQIVAGGVREQATQSLENLRSIIAAAGGSLADVVKTTVFLRDMSAFGEMNDVYGQFFGSAFPARSCVEVSRLPKDALVEIEAIAAIK